MEMRMKLYYMMVAATFVLIAITRAANPTTNFQQTHTLIHSLARTHMCARVQSLFVSFLGAHLRACWLTRSLTLLLLLLLSPLLPLLLLLLLLPRCEISTIAEHTIFLLLSAFSCMLSNRKKHWLGVLEAKADSFICIGEVTSCVSVWIRLNKPIFQHTLVFIHCVTFSITLACVYTKAFLSSLRSFVTFEISRITTTTTTPAF